MSLSRHETRPLFWSLLAVTGLMLQLLPALSGTALAQPAGEAAQAAAPEDEKKEKAATPQSDDKKGNSSISQPHPSPTWRPQSHQPRRRQPLVVLPRLLRFARHFLVVGPLMRARRKARCSIRT